MPVKREQVSTAWLIINDWLRRQPDVGELVTYPSLVMLYRLYTRQKSERPVSIADLLQDVVPELVSEPTARRYIYNMQEKGLLVINRTSRDSTVMFAEAYMAEFEQMLDMQAKVLGNLGFKYDPDLTDFTIWVTAQGEIVRHQNAGRIFPSGRVMMELAHLRELMVRVRRFAKNFDEENTITLQHSIEKEHTTVVSTVRVLRLPDVEYRHLYRCEFHLVG